MSLDRKDVRAKLDHDIHRALTVICEVDGREIGEFIENELVRIVKKRVHDATVIAAFIGNAGLTGKIGE